MARDSRDRPAAAERRPMAQSGRTFLVECYLPGVDEAAVAAAGERARLAADGFHAQGREIAYLGATLVAADEAVFHAFQAQDAAVVREAASMADLAFERVVESIRVAGDGVMAGSTRNSVHHERSRDDER